MTISEYLDSIKERLLTDPIVAGFQLIRERATPNLPDFPHHVHDGVSGLVIPSQLTNIFAVLDEIKQRPI